MNHKDFVEAWDAQTIDVKIHKSLAGHLFKNPYLLSQKYRKQQVLLRVFAFSVLLLGIVMFFFLDWYIALIIFLFGLFLFPVCQAHASKSVLNAALESPNLFAHCLESGIIKINKRKV